MKRRWKIFGLAAIVCSLPAGCMTDKKPNGASPPPAAAVKLEGTQWTLEELNGKPVIENSRATLKFPEDGKVAGNGSCNRFTGAAKVSGSSIKLGPLASTRMMCEGPSSTQETEYLKALESAERFEVKEGKLYVHVSGTERPLVFRSGSQQSQ